MYSLLVLLCLAALLLSAVADSSLDKQWMSFLETPPRAATQMAAFLSARADSIVKSLMNSNNNTTNSRGSSRIQSQIFVGLGEVDVVVSGGANWDAYYMGIQMLLSRLQQGGFNVTVNRYRGASAGGMMPFEVALKGEILTLQHHLAYGYLEQTNPKDFTNQVSAASTQDHHWRLMSAWMMSKWQDRFVRHGFLGVKGT